MAGFPYSRMASGRRGWVIGAGLTLALAGCQAVPARVASCDTGSPPRKLVVAGLYRSVRNPQYVGVLLVAVGEALLAQAGILFGYAAFLAVAYHLFVQYYEEPTLSRLFGESYLQYREAVPRWLPRWPV